METNNLVKPYLTRAGETPHFPTIPHNYGVKSRPIILVTIVGTILTLLLGTVTFFAYTIWDNIPVAVLTILLIMIIAGLLWLLFGIHHKNVDTTYRTRYIQKVLQPWFINYYDFNLYDDQVNLFLTGTPVFVGGETYVYPRLNTSTSEIYMSFSNPLELKNADNTINPTHPRVKLNPTSKHNPHQTIPENYGFVVLNLNGELFAVYKNMD